MRAIWTFGLDRPDTATTDGSRTYKDLFYMAIKFAEKDPAKDAAAAKVAAHVAAERERVAAVAAAKAPADEGEDAGDKDMFGSKGAAGKRKRK